MSNEQEGPVGAKYLMMASRYKDKDAGVVLSFNGQWVSWTHTAVAYGTAHPHRSHCDN